MNQEEYKMISNAADSLSIIRKALAILQGKDKLYIVSDYSVKVHLDFQDLITIPQNLLDELKQKLIAYYGEAYNEIVKDLKEIEL